YYQINITLNSIINLSPFYLTNTASGSGTINGTLLDPVTGQPIPFAFIRIYYGSFLIASGLTDANGVYNFSVPAGSNISYQISANGYITFTYPGFTILANQINYYGTIYQISDAYSGEGNFSGTVLNALNSERVGGLNLDLRA